MFTKYRNKILVMLFASGVINYLDRSALSVAAPLITKEFNLTAAELGMIFSVFFIGYAIFNFVGGYLADKLGPRKVFIYAMTFWSLACGATALAWNFVSLLVVRALFGVGEGPISETVNKTVNNWFPKKERARAIGIGNCGQPLGGALSAPIVGFIAIHYGWRIAFVSIVILGIVWTLVWAKIATDYPHQNLKISKEEISEIEGDQELLSDVSENASLGFYLKQPIILFTALGFFAYNYILFFFLTWFPSYLVMAKHLSIKDMSLATVIPWVIGSIGLATSGILTDYIYNKTGKLLFSRKVVLVGGLLGAAVTVGLTGFASSVTAAVALMSIGICFLYLTGSIYWAIIQDNVRGSHVGGVGGFVHGLANISGIIAPTVTGFIVSSTGSFTSAFIVAGVLAVVAALMVALFVKPISCKKQAGQAL